MTTRTITTVTVYWDTQDPGSEGWAYRASDDSGLIDSGSLDADSDDLDGAIDEAISMLDLDARTDEFSREPHIDGGYAVWTRPDQD